MRRRGQERQKTLSVMAEGVDRNRHPLLNQSLGVVNCFLEADDALSRAA